MEGDRETGFCRRAQGGGATGRACAARPFPRLSTPWHPAAQLSTKPVDAGIYLSEPGTVPVPERERDDAVREEPKMPASVSALLDVVDEPLAVLDDHGGVYQCNDGLLGLLGAQHEEVVGRPYPELVDADDRPVASAVVRRLRRGDRVDGVTVAVRGDGGRRRTVRLSARPLRDGEGRVSGALAVHRPSAAGPEAHRDIAERELAAREHELEVVRQELQTFVHSVSHDLRRPLRVVNGFVEALQEDYGETLPAGAHDFLRRVREGTRCMAHLLDALLDLSRVSGRPLRRERVDLAATARQVAGELRQAMPENRVECRVEGPLPAKADPGLLRILFHNLLENAWKYATGEDPARVEVGCKRLNGRPVYYVRDNGPGFAPREADLLFAPFQRLHCGTGEGSGIGLAIAQRIVHRHEGQIWAEGAPGRGAAFYFTLGSEKQAEPMQLSLLE